jgi:hypothetical protein
LNRALRAGVELKREIISKRQSLAIEAIFPVISTD